MTIQATPTKPNHPNYPNHNRNQHKCNRNHNLSHIIKHKNNQNQVKALTILTAPSLRTVAPTPVVFQATTAISYHWSNPASLSPPDTRIHPHQSSNTTHTTEKWFIICFHWWKRRRVMRRNPKTCQGVWTRMETWRNTMREMGTLNRGHSCVSKQTLRLIGQQFFQFMGYHHFLPDPNDASTIILWDYRQIITVRDYVSLVIWLGRGC